MPKETGLQQKSRRPRPKRIAENSPEEMPARTRTSATSIMTRMPERNPTPRGLVEPGPQRNRKNQNLREKEAEEEAVEPEEAVVAGEKEEMEVTLAQWTVRNSHVSNGIIGATAPRGPNAPGRPAIPLR